MRAKLPATLDAAPPILPLGCKIRESGQRLPNGLDQILNWHFDCAAVAASTESDIVLPWDREGALVTIQDQSGNRSSRFLEGRSGNVHLSLAILKGSRATPADAAKRYMLFGIEHILSGIDHLLFVFGLLLLVRGGLMLIKTITAFTIGHSVSLALVALGLFAVPGKPVEAIIALSIMFLAAELIRAKRGQKSLTILNPWLASLGFGLLHGLGFAGAFADLGLDGSSIPMALLMFNVGVEVGQLIFVAGLLMIWAVLRKLDMKFPKWTDRLPAAVIGSVAAFWFIGRMAVMF